MLVVGFGLWSYGQVTESRLIGSWKVKKIIRKSSNKDLRGTLDGFKSATFTFMENKDFKLTTNSKAPAFQMMLKIHNNPKWKFDAKTQCIKIGAEEDGYSLMGIYPVLKNSGMEFSMEQSTMVFKMKKVR